jgi:hypothetical protein
MPWTRCVARSDEALGRPTTRLRWDHPRTRCTPRRRPEAREPRPKAHAGQRPINTDPVGLLGRQTKVSLASPRSRAIDSASPDSQSASAVSRTMTPLIADCRRYMGYAGASTATESSPGSQKVRTRISMASSAPTVARASFGRTQRTLPAPREVGPVRSADSDGSRFRAAFRAAPKVLIGVHQQQVPWVVRANPGVRSRVQHARTSHLAREARHRGHPRGRVQTGPANRTCINSASDRSSGRALRVPLHGPRL